VAIDVLVTQDVVLRVERQVRAVDDLAGGVEAGTSLTPVSMTATSTPLPV
jgi:hypothetical protein